MTLDTSSFVGKDALELIPAIVSEHPGIQEIQLVEPEYVPAIQERITMSKEEQALIEAGLRLRASHNLPFWDSVLLSTFNVTPVPVKLLQEVLHHQPLTQHCRVVKRKDLTAHYLRDLATAVPPTRMLAMSSSLKLADGSIRHLPMLDFHCPASSENLSLVGEVVRKLAVGNGFVLKSNKSYHFYGRELLTANELKRFLGRALLFAPVVDRAWIAHQLIESACALRISANRGEGTWPFVVVHVASK